MLDRAFQYLQDKRVFSRFYLDLKFVVRIRKPKLIVRVAHNYLVIILLRKRLLRSVDFAPTYSCNMNCAHCFASPMFNDKKEVMTPEDFKKAAAQAKRMGAVHFAFQGGEPLLLEDLEKIIRSIDPSDSFVSITTNGFLLTKERVRRLRKVGVDMVTISIDSGIPSEHDDFRKVKGAFGRAVEAIKIAQGCGLMVTVNTTITRENILSGGFERIVKLCDRLRVKLNILFPAVSGRYADRVDLVLSKEDKEAVRKIIDKYIFIRRDLDANYMTYGCGAVKEMIYISPYGEVMPCSFIHVLLGNIKTDSLESCVEKGLGVPYFSTYYPVCLPMEDIGFINKHMSRISKSKTLPADFNEVFSK